jgi:hypothetical protein
MLKKSLFPQGNTEKFGLYWPQRKLGTAEVKLERTGAHRDALTCTEVDIYPCNTFSESGRWQSPKFKSIPSPYGYSKYALVGVWAVAWPVISDKNTDGKGACRSDLEQRERRGCHSWDTSCVTYPIDEYLVY